MSSSDPWRYECPDCESVVIDRLFSGKRPRGKRYKVGGVGVKEAAADRRARYLCRICGTRHNAVHDKKSGKLTTRL